MTSLLSFDLFSFTYNILFPIVIVSSLLVIINAILSAKSLGGTLGKGLKKVATGTSAHSIVFITYVALKTGMRGALTDDQISVFFIVVSVFGSIFLVLGFFEIYKIARKLKLFTI